MGDGQPAIAVDYSETTPAMGFMHNEMRIANWDKENPNNSTYLGFMWVKVGMAKIRFAYFIPDKVEPYICTSE